VKIEIQITDEKNITGEPFTLVSIRIHKPIKTMDDFWDHWDCESQDEARMLLPRMINKALNDFKEYENLSHENKTLWRL